jgi:hypothetical protein
MTSFERVYAILTSPTLTLQQFLRGSYLLLRNYEVELDNPRVTGPVQIQLHASKRDKNLERATTLQMHTPIACLGRFFVSSVSCSR